MKFRKILLCSVVAFIVVAIIELTAFLTTIIEPRLYDNSSSFLADLLHEADRYDRFLEQGYDPITGWDNPSGMQRIVRDCLGSETTETFDDRGARVTGNGGVTGPVRVITVGDSFTRGNDVDDSETYPSELESLLGRKVANYGVSGFGPVQSLLLFERHIETHRTAQLGILGIMYENILRMRNSFRPAFDRTMKASDGGLSYAVKPFAHNGQIVPNINGPLPAPFPEFLDLVRSRFREDYWRQPEATQAAFLSDPEGGGKETKFGLRGNFTAVPCELQGLHQRQF